MCIRDSRRPGCEASSEGRNGPTGTVGAITLRRLTTASERVREPCMHDGSEFLPEPGPARVAFLDAASVEVLLVADRGGLASELRECLAKFTACAFEVAEETE